MASEGEPRSAVGGPPGRRTSRVDAAAVDVFLASGSAGTDPWRG